MAFIVDIKTKVRIPGKSWDVFAKYLNDDPVPLGTIEYDANAAKDDRWVPRSLDNTYPLTWAPTKELAVRFISSHLKYHFDDCEVHYGKKTWRIARFEVDEPSLELNLKNV
jgi:hypothetical protein